MLERDKRFFETRADDCGEDAFSVTPGMTAGAMSDREFEMDNELQAAIEYKIATCGVHGAETVLDLLNVALRRLLR